MNAAYPLKPQVDHDYNARDSVASFDEEYASLVALSRLAQTTLPVRKAFDFGAPSRATLDLYGVAPGRPVFLWIHGGYWRIGNKEDNAFAAPGLVAHGVAVAVMDYSLAPYATLETIVNEVRQAVGWLYRTGPSLGLETGKIHVGGSSAGGHLTGTLLMPEWTDTQDLPSDVIGAALSLSGIYDLEPLLHTQVNTWMNMDMAMAKALSPIHHIPKRTSTRLVLSVGGLERDGFLRETANYHAAWAKAGHPVHEVKMTGYNHFDITGTLSDPQSALVQATLNAMADS